VVAATPLPPGPRAPVALQTLLAWGPWGDRTLAALHRRYGDIFTVRIEPSGTMVFLADPAAVRAVFTGSPSILHAGEGNEILRPVLGERSVLVADGAEHLARRRLMLPMFHGEAIHAYAEIIRTVAGEELDRWPLQRTFKLQPRMKAITFEVILRAVFGVNEPARLDRFRATIPPLVEIGLVEMMLWIEPRLARLPPWRRYASAHAMADRLLREEIVARRRDPSLGERRDILSLLVRAGYDDASPLTDDDVRDQLVTLLLAGHETTGTALAWAVERLLCNPDVLERARRAAREGDDAYLDAVGQETLRARPVITAVARKLKAPMTIGGYELPAGVTVAPAIGLIQHSPAVYPDPDRFRPERFLDGDAPSYAWIPFGGGTRRCLGAGLAQLELRLVLAELLRRTRLAPAFRGPERQMTRHITNVPRRGVPVRLLERRAAAAAVAEARLPATRPGVNAVA
jgi:cytochrome P450